MLIRCARRARFSSGADSYPTSFLQGPATRGLAVRLDSGLLWAYLAAHECAGKNSGCW